MGRRDGSLGSRPVLWLGGGWGGQTGAAPSMPSALLLEQLTATPSRTSWLGGVWPLLLALRAPHDPSHLCFLLFSFLLPFAHPTPSSSLTLTPPSTPSNTLSSALPPTPPTTRSIHQLFLSRLPTHLHGCISSLFFSPISPRQLHLPVSLHLCIYSFAHTLIIVPVTFFRSFPP